jgi:uncharacterized protein (DUF2141 family)
MTARSGQVTHLEVHIMKALAVLAVAVAATVASATSAADPPLTGVLTVRISQLRSNNGQVGCALYKSADGFPTDPSKATQMRWCSIREKASPCAFDPIPAGTYAVACFHDENGNGRLDKNFLGIPQEGTVVSNHAKGFMGPPPFDKAKFSFSGAASALDLRTGY